MASSAAYLATHDRNLPYLNRIVTNLITLDPQNIEEVLPYCLGVLQYRLTSPSLIELIWSYWLEEGMLVQTMNAIARRFQNRRGSRERSAWGTRIRSPAAAEQFDLGLHPGRTQPADGAAPGP